jgi:hypothetical protein
MQAAVAYSKGEKSYASYLAEEVRLATLWCYKAEKYDRIKKESKKLESLDLSSLKVEWWRALSDVLLLCSLSYSS